MKSMRYVLSLTLLLSAPLVAMDNQELDTTAAPFTSSPVDLTDEKDAHVALMRNVSNRFISRFVSERDLRRTIGFISDEDHATWSELAKQTDKQRRENDLQFAKRELATEKNAREQLSKVHATINKNKNLLPKKTLNDAVLPDLKKSQKFTSAANIISAEEAKRLATLEQQKAQKKKEYRTNFKARRLAEKQSGSSWISWGAKNTEQKNDKKPSLTALEAAQFTLNSLQLSCGNACNKQVVSAIKEVAEQTAMPIKTHKHPLFNNIATIERNEDQLNQVRKLIAVAYSLGQDIKDSQERENTAKLLKQQQVLIAQTIASMHTAYVEQLNKTSQTLSLLTGDKASDYNTLDAIWSLLPKEDAKK